MPRPLVHFLHANGFPGRCYRKFLRGLEREFRVEVFDKLGHDPRYPVTDGWPHLVEEVIDALEARRRAPVVGLGHSLGAMVTLMAAVLRPDLFRAIVLLDAPIIGPWKGTAFRMIKRLGLVDRVTPAGATRGRRREWPDAQAALAHFRAKPVFRSFDIECLEDYVRFGTVKRGGRLRLAFDPAVEYEIYRTIPHDLVSWVPLLGVPAGMLIGRDSDVVARVGLAHTRRRFVTRRLAGGHLFPFERPEEAAAAVTDLVHLLLAVRPHE